MTSHSKILVLALLCVAPLCAADQAPLQWGDSPLWGDQGDGTYRNPVLPGDLGDIE